MRHNDDIEILISSDQIASAIAKLGETITRDFDGIDLIVICVLKGSLLFTSDLIRHIDNSLDLDFVAVKSYYGSIISSGTVEIVQDVKASVEGKTVLLVEDIADTGRTIDFLCKHLNQKGASRISVCALLDKPSKREVEIDLHYRGFEIEDRFVIGYGLDFNEKYRNLPYIGVLSST